MTKISKLLCVVLMLVLSGQAEQDMKTSFSIGKDRKARKQRKGRHPVRKQLSTRWCPEGKLLHPMLSASCVPEQEVFNFYKVSSMSELRDTIRSTKSYS